MLIGAPQTEGRRHGAPIEFVKERLEVAAEISSETNLTAYQWWEARRLRYNIALVVAGILAFVAYLIVLHSFSDRIPDAEITLFTILFQGIGYLSFMVVANVFYFWGRCRRGCRGFETLTHIEGCHMRWDSGFLSHCLF